MKRRWIFIGAVALPLALFVATRVTQDKLSWKPRLVGVNPDGECTFTWSRDGRLIRLTSVDIAQNTQWYGAIFDAWSRKRLPDQTKFVASSSLELQFNNEGHEGEPNLKADALSVCDAGGHCQALHGTDDKRFGLTMQTDPTSFYWNFDDMHLLQDEREFSVLSGGTEWTWATKTGLLLRHVPLKIEGACFSSSDKIFWIGRRSNSLKFVDRRGRLLWKCATNASPVFARAQSTVVIAGDKGLEVRDLRTGKIERTIEGPSSSIVDMALSPDDSWVWSSHHNGEVWSWRVQ